MIPPAERFADEAGTRVRRLHVRRSNLSQLDDGYQFALSEISRPDMTLKTARFEWGDPIESGCAVPDAEFFGLAQSGAQALMDELWSLGLRPSRAEPEAGQISAMEAHLRDLRAVTRHVLKMPLDGSGI